MLYSPLIFFMIGKDDNAVPLDNVLPQITLPRVSSIHIFENVGHMGMWEAAQGFNEYLEEFLNESA